MIPILKVLLAVTTIFICVYGVSVFGISMWPVVFSALSVFLLLSICFEKLRSSAVIVAKVMGVMSLFAFALLLLASTVGGSAGISESNQIIAIALAFIAIFGCAFFLAGRENAGT